MFFFIVNTASEGSVILEYQIPDQGHLEIAVFDMSGSCIKMLHADVQVAGKHSIIWNGTNDHQDRVEAGIYICNLKFNGMNSSARLIMLPL